MSNKEPVQLYRISIDMTVKVFGGNDKDRRISAKEYISCLLCYPLFEGDAAETHGIGWTGVDESEQHNNRIPEVHAPYQFDQGIDSYRIKSVRKVGPIEYEDNSHRWIEEDHSGSPW